MTTLDQSQQSAVDKISLLNHSTYCLTGGPGHGKTYTIRHLLQSLWSNHGTRITPATTYLAAPTGRAAKVMAYALSDLSLTNAPATIHRMLGFKGNEWTRNATSKLNADLVVLDESSMADSLLLFRVIDALPPGCILILVGDYNQLPPVEVGAPFQDIIQHGDPETICRLTNNHRQIQGSLIALACTNTLAGQPLTFGQPGEHTLQGQLEDDLFFHEHEDKEEVPARVLECCRPWHDAGEDYAVLAPQRTGVCGVENINKYLQEHLNPSAPDKAELKVGFTEFREGDKIKITKNNYDLNVFNGYTGTIENIDISSGELLVSFDGEEIAFNAKDFKDVTLGYCTTIHASQGSQYKYGVIIAHSSHWHIWSKPLLYTSISRFRKELHIVGDGRAIKRGLSNAKSSERNTFIGLELSHEVVEERCNRK